MGHEKNEKKTGNADDNENKIADKTSPAGPSKEPGKSTDEIIDSVKGSTKDPLDKMSKSGIYEISCSQCDKSYIGQTKRSLGIRFNEHIREAGNKRKKGETNNFRSKVAEHMVQEDHAITRADVDIVRMVSDNRKLDVAESMEICKRRRDNLLNTDSELVDKLNLEKNMICDKMKKFTFWSTQPVPKMNELVQTNESIEPNKDISEIRQEPYTLPDGFKWDTLDLNDPKVLNELYILLYENYVEDDDEMFRFDYQPAFLKWSLQPPGWIQEWHVGVRIVKSGRLVGFISAIPGNLRSYDQVLKIVEINFLCVHKKLRSKRVAPVLIREITRRVNLKGIFQAAYTAGVVLPKPIATCRYWHRSLNPRKLIEVKFSQLSRNMTMQRTIKLYKLPDAPKTRGFRKIEPRDMNNAHKLLDGYLKKFKLCPVFSNEEFQHWFTPIEGIIDCFVVEDENGEITDMVSYYSLPSSVMHHPVHKTVRAAYSFYNVSTKTPWIELMNDALISAKNIEMDVFNALDVMENETFLGPLKFGSGDGNLQYYLYNWKCPRMQPAEVALILM